MKKSQIVWVVIAAVLIFVGLGLGLAGLICMDFDFTQLNTANTVTNTYTISEKFYSINIDVDECDLNFVLSDTDECKVVCFEENKAQNKVEVKNGVLTVENQDNRKWYDRIGVYWADTKITLYLPEKEYEVLEISDEVGDILMPSDFSFSNAKIKTSTGDVDFNASIKDILSVDTDTGDITVNKINSANISLNTDTGDIDFSEAQIKQETTIITDTGSIKIDDLKSDVIKVESDTGDMLFENVIALKNFKIESDTGDIVFDGCDADSFDIETETGDVSGSLLTAKIFLTETQTGSINVPKTLSGGRFTVKTDTGDIKLNLE